MVLNRNKFLQICIVSIIAIFLISVVSCSQNESINNTDKNKTTNSPIIETKVTISKNGLILREEPNIKSKRITTLPYNTKTNIHKYSKHNSIINGMKNKWAYITTFLKNQKYKGWVFTGYLAVQTNDIVEFKYSYNYSLSELTQLKKINKATYNKVKSWKVLNNRKFNHYTISILENKIDNCITGTCILIENTISKNAYYIYEEDKNFNLNNKVLPFKNALTITYEVTGRCPSANEIYSPEIMYFFLNNKVFQCNFYEKIKSSSARCDANDLHGPLCNPEVTTKYNIKLHKMIIRMRVPTCEYAYEIKTDASNKKYISKTPLNPPKIFTNEKLTTIEIKENDVILKEIIGKDLSEKYNSYIEINDASDLISY